MLGPPVPTTASVSPEGAGVLAGFNSLQVAPNPTVYAHSGMLAPCWGVLGWEGEKDPGVGSENPAPGHLLPTLEPVIPNLGLGKWQPQLWMSSQVRSLWPAIEACMEVTSVESSFRTGP
jgi:hypothetical protein